MLLLSMSIRGSMLILAILIIKLLTKNRLNPNLLFSIWLVAIIGLCNPYIPESIFSIQNIWTDSNIISVHDNIINDLPVSNNIIDKQNTTIATSSVVHRISKIDYNSIVNKTYLIVLFTLILSTCFRYILLQIRLSKERKSCIIKDYNHILKEHNVINKLRIIRTDIVKLPSIIGLIKPTILLPSVTINSLSKKEIEYIVIHEIMHYKRKDILITWIMTLTKFIHWFNPLVWIGIKTMTYDMELACDSKVKKHIKPNEYKDYGTMILNIIHTQISNRNNSKLILSPTIINTKNQLKRRMYMISNKKKYSIVLGVLVVICIPFLLATIFTKGVNSNERTNLPPQELIANNMKSTDASLYLTVINSNKVNEEGILKTYDIEAKVDEVFKGDVGVGTQIHIIKTVEDDSNIYKKNDKILGSFNMKENNIYTIPDMAFDFPYSDKLYDIFKSTSVEVAIPKELIKSNIDRTDCTIIGEINKVTKDKTEQNYSTYIYDLKIVKSYKGDFKEGQDVKLIKTIEKDAKPYSVNSKIIGSFDINENNQLISPDVAYDFAYTKGLETLFDEATK